MAGKLQVHRESEERPASGVVWGRMSRSRERRLPTVRRPLLHVGKISEVGSHLPASHQQLPIRSQFVEWPDADSQIERWSSRGGQGSSQGDSGKDLVQGPERNKPHLRCPHPQPRSWWTGSPEFAREHGGASEIVSARPLRRYQPWNAVRYSRSRGRTCTRDRGRVLSEW